MSNVLFLYIFKCCQLKFLHIVNSHFHIGWFYSTQPDHWLYNIMIAVSCDVISVGQLKTVDADLRIIIHADLHRHWAVSSSQWDLRAALLSFCMNQLTVSEIPRTDRDDMLRLDLKTKESSLAARTSPWRKYQTAEFLENTIFSQRGSWTKTSRCSWILLIIWSVLLVTDIISSILTSCRSLNLLKMRLIVFNNISWCLLY